MRTSNAVIAALLGLGFLAPAPALAQAPDLGPDWDLVGTRKVKNWVAHPANPEDGEWELVDHNTYRIFQENLENPAPGMPALPAPEIQKGAVKRGSSFDEKGGIERVRKGLMVHKYQTIITVTPQTQTQTTIHKGWKLSEFTRQETRSRALRTKYGLYDISFQVPVSNYRWDVIETGRSSRDVALDPLKASRVVELLPPERSSEVSSLAKADGNRPSAFRGDAGSGGKASLSASQLRQNMGANQVKASEIALTPEQIEEAQREAQRKAEEQARAQLEAENKAKAEAEEARKKAAEAELAKVRADENATKEATQSKTPVVEAGLSLDKVLGTWVSSGGKSSITILRVGNSHNMKISTELVLGSQEKIAKTFEPMAFSRSWQGNLGKDKLGAEYVLKASFSEKGDRMSVRIWRDGLIDATVAEDTFTQKK